jgi:catechol 2,3-dioxygenase-like lactoylglutathione lyase family enzyme
VRFRAALGLVLALAAHALAWGKPLVQAVESVGVTVADMERSVRFYTEVLAFERVSDVELTGETWEHLQGVFPVRMRVVRLRLGDEQLELTEYLAPRGRPVPIDSRSNDRWFQHVAIIVSDMERAYARLRTHRVEHASSGPQRLPDWNQNAGGIEAFYFRDPDGHPLEILEFPPGKGDAKWQRGGERLFLGIDHTAVVVGDTETSLAFYRDALGLRLSGESENHGPEQERLNAVFGARLRITALRAAGGPGIELLEYLAPRGGRPYPPDSSASDLWHWQTRLRVRQLNEVRTPGLKMISPGAVNIPGRELGFGAGVLGRDPDGHAVQLVE